MARTRRRVGAQARRERTLGRPLPPAALRGAGVALSAAKQRQELHGREAENGKGTRVVRCDAQSAPLAAKRLRLE